MSEDHPVQRPIPPQALAGLISEAQNTLHFMAEMGCKGFDFSKEGMEVFGHLGKKRARPRTVRDSLEGIRADMGDCRRCGLHAGRGTIVFGSGNPAARLLFVGEGPGYDEDRIGQPFVGAAGQLLDKIIQAIRMTRGSVYICYVVKCRLPNDRRPEPGEIQACAPFLERQIACVQPEFICALGAAAAQTLLQTTTLISDLRGRFYDYKGIRLIPTYHPAYLLRSPDKKKEVWEDMKMLMREMGHETGA
jgi:DNA polymerase